VNGVPMPFLEVKRRKYRFRFLNGSNARVYRLALSTGEPFTVIASDAGLLHATGRTPEILISMSERYHAIIDFSRYPTGEKVILENRREPAFGDPIDEAKTREIMRFDVVENAGRSQFHPSGTFDANERYNPGTDSWETMPPLPTARHGLGAVALGDRIYALAGGSKPGGSSSAMNEVFIVLRETTPKRPS